MSVETTRQAARRLASDAIKGAFVAEALHHYKQADGTTIYWRIRCRLSNGDKWIRPMHRDENGYQLGEPPEFKVKGFKKPLYGLDELAKADPDAPVWLVEGEAKVDALRKCGIVATTAGGATSDSGADFEPLRGRTVVLWPDNDEAGKHHMQRVAAILRGIGCTVEVVAAEAIGLSEHGDVVDWLAAHPNAAAPGLMALPRVVELREGSVASVADVVVLRRMADITAQSVRWLWPGRIARGKVTLIAGHPGLGKSQLSASLAAIVTNGGRWPVDRTECERGQVLLLNAEDDAADTIRPRLDAAGADVRRVHILDAVREIDSAGRSTVRLFSLAEDLEQLDRTLRQLGDIALVVIDPISAYLGGTDSHKNADIRALLAPLSEIAGRHSVAIVLVSHLNKGSGTGEAMMRVTGSLAFVAAARAAYLVAKDQDDEARRFFLPMKNNAGPDREGLAFRVETVTLPSGIEAPRLAWESEPVTVTADQAMRTELPEHRSGTDDAIDFLREVLGSGPMNASDVKAQAGQVGIEEKPLRRARERLGIKTERQGFGKEMKSFWMLPVKPDSAVASSPAHHSNGARMGTNDGKGTNGVDWGLSDTDMEIF